MKNLFKSLAAFQQEVPVIHKATQGFGYSYADLPAIFDKINPLLAKHGLGFTQMLQTKEGVNYICTMIFHVESGENLETSVAIPNVQLKGMNDYQAFGSGVTYYRRYALSSALGLVTDKDTDASGEQVKTEKKLPTMDKDTDASGEQVKTEKKLPTMDNKRFQGAVKAIADGTYTREKLEASFTLTEGQIDILNAL